MGNKANSVSKKAAAGRGAHRKGTGRAARQALALLMSAVLVTQSVPVAAVQAYAEAAGDSLDAVAALLGQGADPQAQGEEETSVPAEAPDAQAQLQGSTDEEQGVAEQEAAGYGEAQDVPEAVADPAVTDASAAGSAADADPQAPVGEGAADVPSPDAGDGAGNSPSDAAADPQDAAGQDPAPDAAAQETAAGAAADTADASDSADAPRSAPKAREGSDGAADEEPAAAAVLEDDGEPAAVSAEKTVSVAYTLRFVGDEGRTDLRPSLTMIAEHAWLCVSTGEGVDPVVLTTDNEGNLTPEAQELLPGCTLMTDLGLQAGDPLSYTDDGDSYVIRSVHYLPTSVELTRADGTTVEQELLWSVGFDVEPPLGTYAAYAWEPSGDGSGATLTLTQNDWVVGGLSVRPNGYGSLLPDLKVAFELQTRASDAQAWVPADLPDDSEHHAAYQEVTDLGAAVAKDRALVYKEAPRQVGDTDVQYRWCPAALTYGGEDVELVAEPDGSWSFSLAVEGIPDPGTQEPVTAAVSGSLALDAEGRFVLSVAGIGNYEPNAPDEGADDAFDYTIYFVDNDSTARVSWEDVVAAATVCFQIEGDDAVHELSGETCGLLGLQEVPAYTFEGSTARGVMTVTCTGLPQQVTYTNVNDAVGQQTLNVNWTLSVPDAAFNAKVASAGDAEGYAYVVGTDAQTFGVNKVVRLCQKRAFDFELKAGRGLTSDAGLADFFGEEYSEARLKARLLKYLHVDSYVSDTEKVLSYQLQTLVDTGKYDISWSDGAWDDGVVSFSLFAMLPLYDAATGARLMQALSFDQDRYANELGSSYADDHWVTSYDNSGAPNHGSDTSCLWSGGVMQLRHEGTTTFEATKYWADSDPAARPATTFTLLRYSLGSDAATASPVLRATDGGGSSYEAVTFDVAAGATGTSVSVRFADLERYDPDGTPYVYCVREAMGASQGVDYAVKYGTLDQVTGEAQDDRGPTFEYAPGVAESGSDTSVHTYGAGLRGGTDAGYTRSAGDTLVYNGGSVTNVAVGTTVLRTPKTFDAAVYQNQLSNVTCVFGVEWRVAGSGDAYRRLQALDGAPQVNLGALTQGELASLADFTVQMTGFGEETLVKTVRAGLPRYDAFGRELEYRFVESDVYQTFDAAAYAALVARDANLAQSFSYDRETGRYVYRSLFESVPVTPDQVEDGATDLYSSFSLLVADPETGVYRVEPFVATRTYDADGNYELRNTVQDTVTHTVVKKWVDGSGASVSPEGKTATFALWCGETKVATVTFDGDGGAVTRPTYELAAGASVVDALNLTESLSTTEAADGTVEYAWVLQMADLPLYGPRGEHYAYVVTEEAVPSGYHAVRTYDAATHTTTYVNAEGDGGASSTFAVSKAWVDDGDIHADTAASVMLYAKRPVTLNNGEVVPAGGVVPCSQNGATANAYVTLSEANAWFDVVSVAAAGLTGDDVGVYEVCLELGDVASAAYKPTFQSTSPQAVVSGAYAGAALGAAYSAGSLASAPASGADLAGYAAEAAEEYLVADAGHLYQITYGWNEERGSFTVTNTRIGYVDLTVTKSWVDLYGRGTLRSSQEAINESRPAANLELQITDASSSARIVTETNADGADVSYVCLYADGADPEKDEPARKVPVLDAEGNPTAAVQQVDTTTAPRPADYLTSADTGWQSTYAFYNLPKYDLKGAVIHYTATESWADGEAEKAAATYGYTSTVTAESYIVGDLHYHDTQSVAIENRRTGTGSFTFYKEWRDQYVYEVLNKRPDIYLTLYAWDSLHDEPYVYATVFNWEPAYHVLENTVDASNPLPDNGLYYQKATVDGLPLYDENGTRVSYWAVENIVADAASLDYAEPVCKGDTVQAAVQDDGTLKVATDADGNPQGGAAAADASAATVTLLAAGGTFVNGIERSITVAGSKTWYGIPADYAGSLPDIEVSVWRRVLDTDDWEEKIKVGSASDGDAADGAQVFNKSDRLVWTYSVTERVSATTGLPTSIEAFDPYGRLYTYRVTESAAPGLAGTPAAQGADDGYNGQNVYTLGPVSSQGLFALANTYTPATGSLTVGKAYEGNGAWTDADVYPDVTFKLYRVYRTGTDASGAPTYSAATQAQAELTLTGAQQKAGTATVTFRDLDVYTPDGGYWYYYVEEEVQNRTGSDAAGYRDAYTTKVSVGTVRLDADGAHQTGVVATQEPSLAASSKDVQLVALDPEAWGAGARCAGYTYQGSAPVDGSVAADVVFTNCYDADAAFTVQAAKAWDDYDDAFGTRPDELAVALYRTYDGYEGWELVGEKVLDGQGGWSCSFEGLAVWAPNNTRYRYKVEEVYDTQENPALSQYRQVVGSVVTGPAEEGGTAQAGLKNALRTQLTATKAWQNDGDDAYGLRPHQVQVQLQAYVQGVSEAWEPASAVLERLAGDGGLFVEGFDEAVLAVRADGTWPAATWGKLPATVQVGGERRAVRYRVVETGIGLETAAGSSYLCQQGLEPADDAATAYREAWPYRPAAAVTTSDATGATTYALTNTLAATSLTVTKAWDDDADAWGTRAGGQDAWSATFDLWRRVAGGAWEPVRRERDDLGQEGAQVALTLTAADAAAVATNPDGSQAYTKTWYNLPKYDGAGREYEYCAVERARTDYTQAFLDETGAAVAGTQVAPGAVGVLDGQTVRNDLVRTELAGTKAWEVDGGYTVPADPARATAAQTPTLQLERSVDGGATWTKVARAGSTALQPVWGAGASATTWTFTYAGLPRYVWSAAQGAFVACAYRASEVLSAVPAGYHPVYAGGGTASSTYDQGAGAWSNAAVTNELNRFTLAKTLLKSSGTTPEGASGKTTLADVAGTVLLVLGANANGTANTTLYALWTVTDEGLVVAQTWRAGIARSLVGADGALSGQAPAPDYTSVSSDAVAAQVVGLAAGRYVLSEVAAPLGYGCVTNVPLTVNADGSLSCTASTVELQGGADGCTLTVNDRPVELTIAKTGFTYANKNYAARQSPLAGVTFTVTGEFVDFSTHKRVQRTVTLTTGADGKTPKVAGLIVGNDYTVAEQGILDGYEWLYPTVVTILANGTFTFKNGVKPPAGETLTNVTSYWGGSNTTTVTAYDRSAEVKVVKTGTDTNGAGVKGAVFELYLADKDGNRTGKALRTIDLSGKDTATVEGLTVAGSGGTSYVLHEVQAPAGYELHDDVWFSLDDRGGLQVLSDTGEGSGVTVGGSYWLPVIYVADEPVQVTVAKVAGDGKTGALAGATFELYRANDDGSPDLKGLVAGGTTDAAGELVFTKLVAGTAYVLRETAAPAGFELADDVVFTVQADGTALVAGEASGTDRVTVADDPIVVKVAKVAALGTGAPAVAGAVLQVEARNGTTFSDGTTDPVVLAPTDDRGLVTVSSGTTAKGYSDHLLVAYGTYRLTEVVPAPGYASWVNGIWFVVRPDGTLASLDGTPDAVRSNLTNAQVSYENDDDGAALVTATDPTVQARVLKLGVGDEPLAGARFEVEPAAGSYFVDPASGARSIAARTVEVAPADAADGAAIEDLAAGCTYTIRETAAPTGYKLNAGTATFKVAPDGLSLTAVALPDGWSLAEGGTRLALTDEPLTVSVTKVLARSAASQGASLLRFGTASRTGAVFSLTGTFANGATERTLTIGESGVGKVVFGATGLLVAGNVYTLTEVTAPRGYVREESSVSFTLDENGALAPVGAYDASVWAFGAQGAAAVSLTNDPVVLQLAKYAQGDPDASAAAQDPVPLAGAAYTVRGRFAGETTASERTVTTDAAGTAYVDGLVAGRTYTVWESAAPAGYRLSAARVTFTVKADGGVSVTGGGAAQEADDEPASWELAEPAEGSGATAALALYDEPAVFRLVKTGAGGAALKGAAFQIEPEQGSTFSDGTADPVTLAPSDENGLVTLSSGTTAQGFSDHLLKAGCTYRLTETAAPAGYLTWGEGTFVTLSVASDGSAVEARASQGLRGSVQVQDGTLVAAGDRAVGVTLKKVAFGAADVQGGALAGGEPAAGVAFEVAGLFAQDDGTLGTESETRTFTTGADGTVALTGLAAGQAYTVAEKAAGSGASCYEALAAATVAVAEDGTCSFEGPWAATNPADCSTSFWSLEGAGTVLVANNRTLEVEVLKTLEPFANEQAGASAGEAVFSLYEQGFNENGVEELTRVDRASVAASADDPSSGSVTFGGLRTNTTYVLMERLAPEGYALAGRVEFRLDDEGHVVDAAGGRGVLGVGAALSGEAALASNGAVPAITVTNTPITLQVNKYGLGSDADGKQTLTPLAGAAYKLVGVFAGGSSLSTAVGELELVAGEDGTVTVDGLVAGERYTLVETRAPAGYRLAESELTFRVQADGSLALVAREAEPAPAADDDAAPAKEAGWELCAGVDAQSGAAVVNLYDEPLGATVTKYGVAGSALGQDGAATEHDVPLEGTVFEVTGTFLGKSAPTTLELVTGADGTARVGGLVAGNTYTLTETDSGNNPYTTNADTVAFTVDAQGRLAFVDQEGDTSASQLRAMTTLHDDQVTVYDGQENQTVFSISKATRVTETVNGKEVATVRTIVGAEFQVFEVGTDAAGNETTELVATLASTEKDPLPTLAGVLKTGSTYLVRETKTPAGYRMCGESFYLTLDSDGAVGRSENADASGASHYSVADVRDADGKVAGVQLVVVNDRLGVTLAKQRADGTGLAGATYLLAGTFAQDDGTAKEGERFLAFGDAAQVALEGLVASTDAQNPLWYELYEVDAPSGYTVDPLRYRFYVDASGAVQGLTAFEVSYDEQGAEVRTEVPSARVSVGDDGRTVTATDVPTELKVRKVADGAGGSALAGAVFELRPRARATFADGTVLKRFSVTETGALRLLDADGTAGEPVGSLSGLLVANDVYTLTEVQAPRGYEVRAGSFALYVDELGALHARGDAATAGYSIDVEANAVVVSDLPVEVAVRKVLAAPLASGAGSAAGVAFELYEADKDGDPAGTPLQRVETGADGTATFGGAGADAAALVAGTTYVLVEVDPPAGYALADPVAFTVNADGSATLADGTRLAGAVPAVCVTDEPVTVTLCKQGVELGAGGTRTVGLSSAMAYTLGRVDEETDALQDVRTIAVPQGASSVTVDGLEVGQTYELAEYAAPAGYARTEAVLRFTVEGDGSVARVATGSEDAASSPWLLDSTTNTATLTDRKLEVSLTKRAAATATGPGAALPNATYQVSGTFAGTQVAVRTFTTGADGTFVIDRLVGGQTYRVVELDPPRGYRLDRTEYAFTVDAVTGKVAVVAGAGAAGQAGLAAEDGGAALAATDEPVDISIQKYSAADRDKVLAGAAFRVVAQTDTGSTFADGTAAKTVVVVGDGSYLVGGKARASLAGLFRVGGTYSVTEVAAPAGYVAAAGSFVFTVGADGTVEQGAALGSEGASGAYEVTDGGTGIAVYNEPVTVLLRKYLGSGLEFAGSPVGATFQVYRLAAGGEPVLLGTHTVTSATSAQVLLGPAAFEAGQTYRLVETLAPAGYALADPVDFTVQDDGTVVLLSAGTAELGPARVTVRVTDEPIALAVVKVDARDGSALTGASFAVTEAVEAPMAADDDLGLGALRLGGGVFLVEGLVAGTTYRVTETVAPAGYGLCSSAALVRVDANGGFELLEGSGPEWSLVGADGVAEGQELPAGTTCALRLENSKIGFSVQKVARAADGDAGEPADEDVEKTAGEGAADGTATGAGTGDGDVPAADEAGAYVPLAGAVFSIEPTADGSFLGGGTEAVQVETGADGTVSFTDLLAGQVYLVREVRAPAGYVLSGDVLTVTVAATGAVRVAAAGAWVAADGDEPCSARLVDEPLRLTLAKTLHGKGYAELEGADLSGTVFALAADGDDAAAARTVVLDADGTATLDGLVAGVRYTLIETAAPAGYALADPVAFVLDATGACTVVDGAAGWDADGPLLTVQDEPLEVVLAKVAAPEEGADDAVSEESASRPAGLAGAVFELAGARFADTDPGEEGPFVRSVAVGDDGTARIAGLVPGEVYTLTEIVRPEGYGLVEEPFAFRVTDRGAVEAVRALDDGTAEPLGSDGAGPWSLGTYDDGDGASLPLVTCADPKLPEPEPEPGVDPDPDPEPDPKPGVDPDPDPDPEPDPEPGVDPDPDPEPEPDPEPGVDPDPDPEPEPDDVPSNLGDEPSVPGVPDEGPVPDTVDVREPEPAAGGDAPAAGEQAAAEPPATAATEPVAPAAQAVPQTGDATPPVPAGLGALGGAAALAGAALLVARRRPGAGRPVGRR